MQTQDVSDDFLLRFWPWLEANRKLLITIGVALLLGFIAWYYIKTRQQQEQLAAGQAYTAFQMDQPPTVHSQQVVDGYLKIAQNFSGTKAAQRAQLQAALTLFQGGHYADAQKQFQKFLSANGSSSLVPSAQLGVAASLEAQSKLDQALTEYRTIATSYPGTTTAIQAKYSSGRLLQLQNKDSEALTFYQDVAGSPLGGSLASLSRQRIAEIQSKLASEKAATPVTPAKPAATTNSASKS